MIIKITITVVLIIIFLFVLWYINKPKPPKNMTYGEFTRINGDIFIP